MSINRQFGCFNFQNSPASSVADQNMAIKKIKLHMFLMQHSKKNIHLSPNSKS